ncbi:MAG: tetratricopeptide repeat protein [candidate division Zixibacteria bacterium]|nr:tetratricopeptide repeat protein [candidate division Zixibacteria bacterium]
MVASFFPEQRLWGVNLLYYFPPVFRWIMVGIAFLVLAPKINQKLADILILLFSRIENLLKPVNKHLKYSALSLLSLIIFWLLRAKTPLLGDGYLRAGEIKLGRLFSITEPLDFYLHLLVSKLFGLDGYTTYGVLSCIAGALLIFLILLLCDLWGKDGKEKLFIFLILASMGTTQLFFGYIESYSFMFVAMIAYILFGMRYLKQKNGFLWPCLFLLLAVSFHLSALFVLPSLFYLVFATLPQPARLKSRRVKFANMVSLVCVISLIGTGLYLLKAYFPQAAPGSFLIYPFGEGERFYSFFSLAHLLDFLNHQLLISPVSVVLCLVFLIYWRSINFKENAVKFLMGITVCSFGFALLVDPSLGYARDWDLFAFTGLGVTFWGLYLALDIFRKERIMELSRVTLILVVTSLISTLPWILVNASEERAVARLENLLKTDVKRAPYGYETLACYFRDRGEHEKNVKFWKKAIAIDPNPRYFAALGSAYRRLKEYDKAIKAYDRSIQMASDLPGLASVHRNLGNALAQVGRYEEAIFQLKKAISLKPGKADYYYNLGNILGKAGRYEEAVPYFEMALRLDPGNTDALKMVGITYTLIGKKEEAKRYLERYLKLVPKDAPIIEEIINNIETETENGR